MAPALLKGRGDVDPGAGEALARCRSVRICWRDCSARRPGLAGEALVRVGGVVRERGGVDRLGLVGERVAIVAGVAALGLAVCTSRGTWLVSSSKRMAHTGRSACRWSKTHAPSWRRTPRGLERLAGAEPSARVVEGEVAGSRAAARMTMRGAGAPARGCTLQVSPGL